MCCFRGFFLENLHEFEGHFLSDLCVNKMVHASRQNNYLSFWHLLSSQQLLGNNKPPKKTLKTLLSLPTMISENRPIFEGFHPKSQIFEDLYEPCKVYSSNEAFPNKYSPRI